MSRAHCALEFLQSHPEAAARVLERCDADEIHALLRSLPAAAAAPCLERLAPQVAAECLGLLERAYAANILRRVPVPVASALLRRLDPSSRAEILDALPTLAASALRLGLRYPEGTVGSLADPHIVAARKDASVSEAVALARREPRLLRKYLYVVDDSHRLIGTVDVRDCLVRDGATSVGILAQTDVFMLRARTSLESARENPGWSRFTMLPVVDRERVLLGVVRRSAIVDRPQGEDQPGRSSVFLDAAVDVAELYWDATMQIFLPKTPGARRNDDDLQS